MSALHTSGVEGHSNGCARSATQSTLLSYHLILCYAHKFIIYIILLKKELNTENKSQYIKYFHTPSIC